jgi:hypothetical protein
LNQTFDASEHLNDTAVVKQLRPHFLSNLDLAKACITYFSLDVFNNPCYDPEGVEERVRKYKFSSYAACNWTDHVRGVAETDRDVRDAIFKVFGLAGKRESMKQIVHSIFAMQTGTGMPLLHLLVNGRIPLVFMHAVSDDTPNTKKAYVSKSFQADRKPSGTSTRYEYQ